MMSAGTHIPEIEAIFEAKKITHIAIIDDAYNKHPRYSGVGLDVHEQLVADIQASAEIEAILANSGITIHSTDDITEETWIFLWTLAAKEKALAALLERLPIDRNEALKTLRHLEQVLGNDMKRQVSVFGSEDELPDTLAKVIFIDYYLDGTKQGSLELAKRIGSRIKQLYIGEVDKPLIVLMSSRADISEDDRVAFREAAGVIGGMFHFVWKNEFREAERVRVWLYLVTATIEQGRVIQQCVSQMEQAAAESVEALARQLRGLSVDDFGYMQQLTLEKEGEPISEYVVSCLAAFFVQQFRARALTDRQAVDELLFDQLAFGRESPSAEFVKLFMGIVSQPVGGLTRHPRADPATFTKENELPTNVHFGDVFLRGSAALMVATPECDLVATPHQPSNRKFDPDQSVLLIPGAVEAYSKPWNKMPGRTEFVEIDSSPHSVTWDFKRVTSVRVGSLKKHLDDAGYERRLRLSPEFALDVQRMYFADMGRIGLPVGPPIYQPLEVALCCQDVDGTVATLFKTSDVDPHYAVSFVTKTERFFQLTGSFFLRLPGAIQEAISRLEDRAKLVSADAKARGKNGMRIAELRSVSLTAGRLASLRKPFKALNLDAEQDCPVLNTVIKLSTKKIPEGLYTAERPLLLVIGPKQRPIAPPKLSAATPDASFLEAPESGSVATLPVVSGKAVSARVKPSSGASEPVTKAMAKRKAFAKSALKKKATKKESARKPRTRK